MSPDRSPPAGGREAAAADGGGGTEVVQLQLQAALSALGAMEEMWGPEQSVETPAAELLRRESNSLVVARCADLGAEAAALRDGLAELKHAHTSARSLCFKRLRSVRALVEKAAAAGGGRARPVAVGEAPRRRRWRGGGGVMGCSRRGRRAATPPRARAIELVWCVRVRPAGRYFRDLHVLRSTAPRPRPRPPRLPWLQAADRRGAAAAGRSARR